MKTKKPKLLMNGHTDEVQTPAYAIEYLLPYIKKDWIIWECAWGKGSLAKHFENKGFKVIGSNVKDFMREKVTEYFDCLITNPPYSMKEEFLERCYEIGKPFAMLLPITALEGKFRHKLYRKHGVQLLLFDKRVNYINHKGDNGCWFPSCWFIGNMGLSKDINFVEIESSQKRGTGK